MASTFGGIYQASGAMNVARYGLEITGQNIANANTPGYTRQRAEQAAIGTPVGVPRIHTGYTEQGGVESSGASRLSDPVLTARARTEHARSAAANVGVTRLADLEDIFNEPVDNGLAAKLDDYWSAWGDVANDPGAQVPREMLINAAESVTVMLHSMDSALDNVADAAYGSLEAKIAEANSAAQELAELNRHIVTGTATGVNINSLLDRRDVLLDTLSTTVGASAKIHGNGSASVTVSGETLVTEVSATGPSTATSIAVVLSDTTSGAPPLGPENFKLQIGGADVTLAGGSASAEVAALETTIPSYRGLLNKVAADLAGAANGVQSAGYDFDGNPGAGKPMFAGGPPITAATIEVPTTFGWKDVAAASIQSTDDGTPTGNPIGNVNGSNALDASLLGTDAHSPDTAYKSLIGQLGMESASAQQLALTQASITASVDVLQQQSSGVSFDEEVANMLTYQMAYQASARVLTVLDDMLDTLINRTGMVGR